VSVEASVVIAALTERRLTIATCESLTGGALAAALTAVPGASAVVRGGLVTYASDLKSRLAGVDAGWISSHGVINRETAVQMAVGVRQRLDADIGISCTGVAGPDPQDGVQPGLVWLAVARGRGSLEPLVLAERLQLVGDRAAIRAQTVDAALDLIVRLLALEPG